MSSNQQQTEKDIGDSGHHNAQQRDVAAASISGFTPHGILNAPLDVESAGSNHGLGEYSSPVLSGFPRPNEAHTSQSIKEKEANTSQDGANKRVGLAAAKDQTDVDHANESYDNGGRFSQPRPLDSVSPGPTALSPPPRSYRDRARKELKGPVLFSEAEDAPSVAQSASDLISSGNKPEFTKKHVRNGTFGQFPAFDLGRTTGDTNPVLAESDEENDSESNSDSSD